MAATLTIVNPHGQTLAAHRLGNTPLSIRAQDQVQYQLAGEGSLAPANVEAARAGNDLLVHIDGQQALRIEDYFLLDDSGLKNPLLGMNESGQYVVYGIVEAPNVLPVEHVLAEEVAGVAAGEGASVSALTAFGIGTLALGGLVLAAQSSSESSATNPDKEQPQTPFDPNQPAPPPADNGNATPPPSGGGNTTPPPSGGGNTNPPPSGGGNNNPPPSGGGNTNPPPAGGGNTNPPPSDGGNTTPPPSGGGNTNPPPSGGGNTNPPPQPPKPNGSITIEGDAKIGQTLTAKISDADGISGSPQYQWLADGQAIANATQSTYTLTAAEKGKAISVQATYTDTKNTAENPSSAATAPVMEDTPAPPPAADTTAPTLVISATPSTLTPGGSTQLTFKVSEAVKGFAADDVIVQGGTLSNFRQVDAQTFTATFTAGAAGKASVTVADDAFVDLANNPNELANLELVIGATPTPQNHAPSDITLSAATLPENQAGAVVGKLTTVDEDKNDQHTYTVSDQRFEVDAQGNLKLKDGVKVEFAQEPQIRLTITTNDGNDGKDGSYSERFTLNVQDDPNYPAPTPPAPNGTVRISGEAKVGGLLTAQVEDADGFLPENIEYQWYADGIPIANALEQTYRPTTDDQGKALTVRASYIDNADQDESPLSAETAPVADAGNGDGKLGVYVPKPTTDFIANVKDAAYGAKGDGHTDDTAAIQKAIDAVAAKGGGIVEIPAGTYMVDGVKNGGINVRSNVIVRMADDTVVQAIPNAEKSYTVFRIHNADNAHILGGTIVGERDAHQGTAGQGGYGVWVLSSHNVVVENVTAKNFWGDGFLVSRYHYHESSPENVVFYNVVADNNRRQGMSITDGNNIKVIQSVFKNTEGHSPESGIDIEPNPSKHSPMVDPGGNKIPGKVTNVEIIDSVFENNTGYGIVASANGDAVVENVRVINNRMDGNLNAIAFNHVIGGEISGNTTLDDGRTIPYFDVDVYNNSQNIIVKDNTLYGGSVRTYEAGSLKGSGHQVSGNHTKAAVFIKGAWKTGATVFAQVEDGDGVPLPKFIQYQWQIDGKDIAGATNREYTIRPEDSGKSLSVRVEFPDGSKQTETAVSKPTLPIDSLTNNAAPTDIRADRPLLVDEGKAGASAGRVRTVDGDRGDDHVYTVSDNRFEIDAYGHLKLKSGETLDYGKEQSIDLTITATDRAGNELSKAFSVAVKDNPNIGTPPTPPNDGKLGVHVPKPTTDFVANVKDAAYGAKGDGKADDTLAVQKAIDAVAEKGGGVVEMPGGTYMIDATAQQGPHSLSRNYPSGLMMKPNVILKLADDTVLKAIPTDQERYNLITFYKADNAHLIGGTLIGERDAHQGLTGQYGYGVRVISSKDVVIEKVTAKDFWGDGFYVGINSGADPQSQNVTFYNVVADNNRRQGLSITDAKGVKVLDSVFKNTSGHMPQSGIDVEPNPGRSTTDIDIRGNRFEGNTGFGVVVSGEQFNGKHDPGGRYADTVTKNINIEDNTFTGNSDGIWIGGLAGGRVAGNTIHYANVVGGPTGGIRKLRLDDMSRDIVVENNTIYGGGYPRGYIEHGKRIEGGGIENLGQNNIVRNNDYKADVFIRGLVKSGETLTAHVYDGDIVSADVRYQWRADGKAIDGANARTYRLTDADNGKRISVHVEFTDGADEKEAATSAETNPVGSPQPNHAPQWAYVRGNYIADETPGHIIGKFGVHDPDPGETFSYRINDERFEIVADQLKLKNGISIDDANEKSVSLAIEITDSGGASFVRELNLTVAEYGTDGKDTFVVDGDGVKTIVGFNVSQGDLLQLESDAFTALEKGTLAESAFTIGHEATSAEQRVIYNAQTGELAYDPDGNGAAAATSIARLEPNLELEAQHIQII